MSDGIIRAALRWHFERAILRIARSTSAIPVYRDCHYGDCWDALTHHLQNYYGAPNGIERRNWVTPLWLIAAHQKLQRGIALACVIIYCGWFCDIVAEHAFKIARQIDNMEVALNAPTPPLLPVVAGNFFATTSTTASVASDVPIYFVVSGYYCGGTPQ